MLGAQDQNHHFLHAVGMCLEWAHAPTAEMWDWSVKVRIVSGGCMFGNTDLEVHFPCKLWIGNGHYNIGPKKNSTLGFG